MIVKFITAFLISLKLFTQEDIDYLAECMYYENYSNGEEAMYLTGAVVLNRRDYCDWCPDTVKGVITQKGQYSTVNKLFTKPIPKECYRIAVKVLIKNDTPHSLIYQSMSKQGKSVYKKINTDYFCLE